MNFCSPCIHLILIIAATQKTFGDRSDTYVETIKKTATISLKTKDLGTNISASI